MTGPEMLKEYKDWRSGKPSDKYQRPFVVGMSANASVADQDLAFSLGMHMYATKPIDTHNLSKIVQASIRNTRVAKVLADLQRSVASEGINGTSSHRDLIVRLG